MQNAKVLRIFLDIYSCPSTLNIHATKNDKKLVWNNKKLKILQKSNKKRKLFMFIGLFYAFSVSIERDIINYQFCEDPAPESWRYEQLPKFIALLGYDK